jgi:hypothetical protein
MDGRAATTPDDFEEGDEGGTRAGAARRSVAEPRRADPGAPGPPDGAPQGANPRSSEHFAVQLRETAGSLFLYASMGGFLTQVDPAAFKIFRDRLLLDAGNPTDPIEVMLIEQLALAHMNIGRLYFRSATADGLEAAKAYGSLAVALTGEFRRSALALQAYRAAGGAVREADDGRLAGNKEASNDGTVPFQEPAAGGRRQGERQEVAGPDAGRPRAAPRRRAV